MQKSSRMAEATLILLFAFLALAAGGLAALMPWHLVLALIAIPCFFLFAAKAPHHATAAAIFLAFGAVPSFMLPQIPFAGGTIKSSELFLSLITIITIFRLLTTNKPTLHLLKSPFSAGLWLIVLLSTISILSAATVLNNNPKYYLYEVRSLLFWLVLPLILLSIDTAVKTKKFVFVLAAMGVVLSIGVIIQFLTGYKVLEASRVETLVTTGSIYSEVTRSTAGGGIYFILFLINVSFALWVRKVIPWYVAAGAASLAALAVLATFGRGVWAAQALAAVLLIALLRSHERTRAISVLVLSVAFGASTLYFSAPNIAMATFDRLTSVGDELEDGESYAWRKEENRFAREAIARNPIIGVGLGGEYQPFRDRNMGEDHTRAIHSSYYGLMLKLGVLGILIPIIMAASAILAWYRIERSNAHEWQKSVALATLCTIATGYITSFTQPEWMHHTGVAFFATSFALLAVLLRISSESKVNK